MQRLDQAVYAAIAETPSPSLDRAFARLSRAADHSKLWLATSALLASRGAQRGRRAAIDGLGSVAVTAAIVNAVLKPVAGRRRPDPAAHGVPAARQVPMPVTRALPSGHAASAFAFAAGVSRAAPGTGAPLTALAALVAYSRIHTGVHYPLDVVTGAVTGAALAPLATVAIRRSLAYLSTTRVPELSAHARARA